MFALNAGAVQSCITSMYVLLMFLGAVCCIYIIATSVVAKCFVTMLLSCIRDNIDFYFEIYVLFFKYNNNNLYIEIICVVIMVGSNYKCSYADYVN